MSYPRSSRPNAASLARCNGFSCPCRRGPSQRAHSIGVRVSDTNSEIVIAATSVIENSRNKRSTIPPMNRIDTNTAARARFIESNVDPTSRAPTSAASKGGFPIST